jgi:hypothetical protein
VTADVRGQRELFQWRLHSRLHSQSRAVMGAVTRRHWRPRAVLGAGREGGGEDGGPQERGAQDDAQLVARRYARQIGQLYRYPNRPLRRAISRNQSQTIRLVNDTGIQIAH